jgi:microcystin-dependent protein
MVVMADAAIGDAGSGDPVDIRQPYLPINFIIHLR